MAIFLPPVFCDGLSLSNVFNLLFHLANALVELSEEFEQPEGIKYPIEYLRFLRGSRLDSFDVSANLITTLLVQGLGIQVVAGDGDGTRDIKEMVILCRELLTSNLSASFPDAAFRSLSVAADAIFYRGLPIELLDEVVECLRDAVKVCPPGSFPVLFALVWQLRTRFFKTHSLHDYEEAMGLLENILDPNRPGECPDSIRDLASIPATQLAIARCAYFKNPEYSEVAISRLRADLSSPSIDEVLRFQYSEILSILVKKRFRDYTLTESLEEANSNNSQVVTFLSSQTLERKSGMLLTQIGDVQMTYSTMALQQKIRYLEELLPNTSPGTQHHRDCLDQLADWYRTKFQRTNDTSDIDESIKYGRFSLDATHANDPWRINPISSLYNTLFLAFEKSGKVTYLNESISVGYDILELQSHPNFHFGVVQRHVSSLLIREKLLEKFGKEDRQEAIRLILLVINSPYAEEPERFRLSCQWATLARSIGHPTTFTAYKKAMSLIQKLISFSPTVSTQHSRLVAMGDIGQTMPLGYASYQIHLGRFEEAVETLEQGRALLWSEMRGLRIPASQLIKEDSPLAQRFAQINQELEALTIAVTPSGKPGMEDGVRDGTDPFGRLVIKRQKLVDEREALVAQIQSDGRPALGELLSVPSFTTLRSAASRGPVVTVAQSLNVKHVTPPRFGPIGLVLVLAFASCFLFLFHHPLLLPESRFLSLFDYFHPRHSLIVVSQTIPIYNKTNDPSFHSAITTLLSSTLLTSTPSIDSISDSRPSLDGLAFVAPHVLGTVRIDITIGVTTRSVLAIPRTLDFVISCHSHRYIFHYSESFV